MYGTRRSTRILCWQCEYDAYLKYFKDGTHGEEDKPMWQCPACAHWMYPEDLRRRITQSDILIDSDNYPALLCVSIHGATTA